MTYPKDPSGINYSKMAMILGMNRNAIYVMRRQNPEKFDYIQGLDVFFQSGYTKYIREQKETISALEKIWFELEEMGEVTGFSVFLRNKGIYKQNTTWSDCAEKSIFMVRDKAIGHPNFLKMKKIVKLYEEYKEKNV